MNRIKESIRLKDLLFLQAIVVIYTLSGVAGKMAASHEFMSIGFFAFYGVEIVILGIYALLWQQVIKRFDLSIAYANRSISLLWSMLWAILFFHETVSLKNLLGIFIVIIGTMIVNGDKNE